MTDSPNKDFNPKHRVVGAIVLVAIAVIVLPLILDSDEDEWHADQDVAESAVENKVFVADLTRMETQVTAATTSTAATPAAAGPVSALTPASPTSAVPAPAPTTVSNATPVSREASVRPTPAPVDKGFHVQVGTFSSEANAKQLADRLKQQGFPVRLEQVRLASGNALRVRVGPYGQQAQAQAARTAIQRKLGVQGIVRAY